MFAPFGAVLRHRPAAALGTLLGLAIGFVAAPAFAAYHYSDHTSFNSNGTNYENVSGVSDNSRDSATVIYRISAGNTAAGRMGARARVYLANGDACAISSTSFNPAPATSWSDNSPYSIGACSGNHYAKGATETWNGSGFDFVSTKRTVNVYLF